jgi:SAM-dependent methyltransferase
MFAVPRLAEIYDLLEGERDDLEPYLAMTAEFGATRVLDVGCGTGTFACLLAERGLEVTGSIPRRPRWTWRGPSRARGGYGGCTATRPACPNSRSTWPR